MSNSVCAGRILTVDEVAEILRCTNFRVYNLIRQGLPAFAIDKHKTGYRIYSHELEAWIQSRRTDGRITPKRKGSVLEPRAEEVPA